MAAPIKSLPDNAVYDPSARVFVELLRCDVCQKQFQFRYKDTLYSLQKEYKDLPRPKRCEACSEKVHQEANTGMHGLAGLLLGGLAGMGAASLEEAAAALGNAEAASINPFQNAAIQSKMTPAQKAAIAQQVQAFHGALQGLQGHKESPFNTDDFGLKQPEPEKKPIRKPPNLSPKRAVEI